MVYSPPEGEGPGLFEGKEQLEGPHLVEEGKLQEGPGLVEGKEQLEGSHLVERGKLQEGSGLVDREDLTGRICWISWWRLCRLHSRRRLSFRCWFKYGLMGWLRLTGQEKRHIVCVCVMLPVLVLFLVHACMYNVEM